MSLFDRLRKKSPKDRYPQDSQTFILEPILTPSGLVDGLDETPDLTPLEGLEDLEELETPIEEVEPSELPVSEGEDLGDSEELEELEFIYDSESEEIEEEFSEPTETETATPQATLLDKIEETESPEVLARESENLPEDGTQEANSVTEPPEDLDPESNDRQEEGEEKAETLEEQADLELVETSSVESSSEHSGVFTVGETGKVSVNFLFDGGKYEGEVGLFSLADMEELEPGSEAFIQEATERVTSDSERGHILISDSTEGAKFSGQMYESRDWNQGEYQGVKTFEMEAGGEYGLVVSPDGGISDAAEEGSPLYFSTDPEHQERIADITGHGRAFAIEDWKDGDRNDLIFQLTGATGDLPELDEVIDPELDWRETETGEEILDHLNHEFHSGVFTVGESGEVEIDFLFDGGKYEGEVSLFSLEGMEEFDIDSKEFIEEAARRSLSNSNEGHIVIVDKIEGAKFEGRLAEGKSHNDGQYLGVKTVQMNAGDRVGVMLVPNSSVKHVFERPDIEGSARPLFSMATANPDDGFHVGQIADVTGEGKTFVMEDIRLDKGKSDEDYNDIIFQIRGATAEVIQMDELIDPEDDWRDSELGQKIVNYAFEQPHSPEVIAPVADIVLTSGHPAQTVNLAQVFQDADSTDLTYTVVEGSNDTVSVTVNDQTLQVNQGAKTGIHNVAIRATDELGNSAIHSVKVVTSTLTQAEINSLNSTLGQLQSAMNLNPQDITVGLSSPAGERAVVKLSGIVDSHPGLSDIFAEPHFLPQIGITPANTGTMQQFMFGEDLALDLNLDNPETPAIETLADALSDSGNPNLDLYQMNGDRLAEELANPEEATRVILTPEGEIQPIEFDETATDETPEETEAELADTPANELPVDSEDVPEEQPEESQAEALAEFLEEDVETSQKILDSVAQLTAEIEAQIEVDPETEEPVNPPQVTSEQLREHLMKTVEVEVADKFINWWDSATEETEDLLTEETVGEALEIERERLREEQGLTQDLIDNSEGYSDLLTAEVTETQLPDYDVVTERSRGADNTIEIPQPETLATRLRNAPPTPVAVIDRGFHGDETVDALTSVNPLAEVKRMNANNWVARLIKFVDQVQESGENRGIVNLSFDLTQIDDEGRVTTRYELTPDEQIAIQYALENNVLLVASAGNTGGEMSALGRAAQQFDNIITVGAIDVWGNPSSYSASGEGLTLVAAGGEFEGDHNAFVGTSKSAAYASGAASLAWAINPELNYQQIKQVLVETAVDLQAPGWDAQTGAGLLNVEEAVRMAATLQATTLRSKGKLEITKFAGEDRVQAALRLASPETQAAIAQLLQQKQALEAQEVGNTKLSKLERQVKQRTQTALTEYQQITTEAATQGAQAQQVATALELALQHQAIEQGQVDEFTGNIERLTQEIETLKQQKTALEDEYGVKEEEFGDRIQQATQALQEAQGDYKAEVGNSQAPISAKQLQGAAIFYRQKSGDLAQAIQQYQSFTNAETILKDKYLYPAHLAQKSRSIVEQLAAALDAQVALLADPNSTEAQVKAGYQTIASLSEQVRQKSQMSADWHHDELQQFKNTTGLTGLISGASRADHIRQRDLFEKLVSQASTNYQSSSYWGGLPNVAADAMAREVEAREMQLKAEEDLWELTQADSEKDIAFVELKLQQAEAELAKFEAKQAEAEILASQTEQRVNDLQDELETLQDRWQTVQSQWEDYLAINRAFLPTETQKLIVENRLQDLQDEELRLEQLKTDIQQELVQNNSENLQAQLEEVNRYLEELEQEQILASVYQTSLEASISGSGGVNTLINRPQDLQNNYSQAWDNWQVAVAAQNVAVSALETTQNSNLDEREQLAQLRDDRQLKQAEFDEVLSQKQQLEAEQLKAQEDLEFTTLQIRTQELLLESLTVRDQALADGEGFYSDLAGGYQDKLWYWSDRTQQYQYNGAEAASHQQSLQHASFLAGERNRVFAQMNEARQRITELQQLQAQETAQRDQLLAQSAPINSQIQALQVELADLDAEIAPLAAVVDPLVATETEQQTALTEASNTTNSALSEFVQMASAQVSAYERLLQVGVLLTPENQDYFATKIQPKVEAYIAQLRQQEQALVAEGLNLGLDEAADTLEEQLENAKQALIPIDLKQQLDIAKKLDTYETRVEALQALLASEDAADKAIQDDTVDAYQQLADTVEQDLQQALTHWTSHFKEAAQLTKDLVKEQRRLSQKADNLVNKITTEFADPHGEYYRSETELQEALSILSVGVQREGELERSTTQMAQDVERLQAQLAQDEQFWNKIAPIVAEYGIDSKQKLQDLLNATTVGSQNYQNLLAQAKANYSSYSNSGHVALQQANWNEEQAKIQWNLSRKNGPYWYEDRWVCRRNWLGKKKCGWETITHIDYHWIAWENHENTGKALRQKALSDLTEAQRWHQEIQRLEPLAQAWTEAHTAAKDAEFAVTGTENFIAELQAGRENIADMQAQADLLNSLLPILQQQLLNAERSTDVARLTVEQAWDEYDPAAQEYRKAVAEILETQGEWEQQALQASDRLAEIEAWIDRESLALGTELTQVLALKQQLENQQETLENRILAATGTELTELSAKLADLQQSLNQVSNKAAVLTAQQTALTQKRTLVTAQHEVISAERNLLNAYLKSPDADTDTLQQQLLDAREALAEAQELAEQAEANSKVLTAPLQELQQDLLAYNDTHLQAAREAQAQLSQLLQATEANANYTLQAAQQQQHVNDLEFQIITRLQEATAAGSREAKHLLDVAQYHNLATAAEIYFRDYSDLASDRGSKYGSAGTDNDVVLARQYQQEMLHYQGLEAQARSQANHFKAIKDAAQSQLATLENQQNAAAAELARLNEAILQSNQNIALHQQELAIAEARVEELDRLRQQTEDTFIQLVRLEQLNLAQAQLERQFAEQRQQQIDTAVEDRLERDRLELERQRLESQYQIEQLKQKQADLDLHQALNQARLDLGEPELKRPHNPKQLQQLTQLQATLAALQGQTATLPPHIDTLLTEVRAEIDLALEGKEAQTIAPKLFQAMNLLVAQADFYKAEIAKLEQQDVQDQLLLQTAQTDVQAASRLLLEQVERSQKLEGEREIINPLYTEALTKVAYAEQAVAMSEEMAANARNSLQQIIDQRIAQRKARKKAFWNDLLGTVTSVLSLVAGVMMLFPPTALIGGLAIAKIGLALSLVSGAISATQAAINGDWMGAIFNGITAATSFVSGGLSQGLKAVANTTKNVWGMSQAVASKVMSSIKVFQSLASGAYSGVRSALSGDSIMGFLQAVGGLASAATAGIGGFVEKGLDSLDSFQQFGYKVLDSLSKAPTLIYGGIKAIENGDLVNGISNVVKGIVSLTKTWTNDFNSENESIGEKVANALENISSVGIGVSKFITGGLDGLLDGLGDMLDGLGDDLSKALEKLIPGNNCECPEPDEEELDEEAQAIFDETIENAHDESLTAKQQKQAELDALSERLQDEDLDPRVKAKVVDKVEKTEDQVKLLQNSHLPPEQQKEVFHHLPTKTQSKWGNLYFDSQFNAESSWQQVIDPKTGEMTLVLGIEDTIQVRNDFVWGVLDAEFQQDPSFGKVILTTLFEVLVGFTPAGIIIDIKDLASVGLRFIENPAEMKNPWNWVDLAANVIGLIPGAGDAVKASYKLARKFRKSQKVIDKVHDYSKVWNKTRRTKIGEAIGEFGALVWAKKNLPGYKRILGKADKKSLNGVYRPQGYDSAYEGLNGEILIIEAKGGKIKLNGQGTIDKALEQANATRKSPTASKTDKDVAQKVLNAHKQGKLSVAVIHTPHKSGVPGQTYVYKSEGPNAPPPNAPPKD
ncbi:DUF4114 domain-containing protein [Roseofilum sp. BLCC_M91]|uniref:DUF4114 domain-containing protein n=1 Tax=Roseofilum halophilum BLCC-M91 TaxID=3022259 RepID=A0ABT7BH88_9CYAN|nr:DUF4114 domain-containing protein [Roseofilum halophilum]MDJ1178445.1 DUF4114 domain-containing protein [Roseofilum halophilum BLCC-M91]